MFNLNIISNMPVIGWSVCILIILICIFAVIEMVNSNRFYKDIINDLYNGKGENKFDNEILSSIYDEFKESAQNGTESINTGAIIDKNLSKILLKEKCVKYSMTLVILLGILGTFIGLTSTLGTALSQSFNVDNISNILNKMSGDMGTAFITSIFGMCSSIILNIFSIYTCEKSKTNFYNSIESYLDNDVFYKHGKSFTNQFDAMRNVFERTMNTMSDKVVSSLEDMTKNVAKIFENGIQVLTDKINGVSLDLSKSSIELEKTVNSMDLAMEKLNSNIARFSEPIESFRGSVENFRVYYEGFDKQIGDLDRIMNQVLDGFKQVSESFDNNNKANLEMSQNLKDNSERLLITYRYISDIVDDFRNNVKISQEVLDNNTVEFNNVLIRLMDLMNNLQSQIKNMAKDMSEVVTKAMVDKSDLIEKKMEECVSSSMQQVNGAVINMQDTLNIFRKSIHSQTKWIEEINDLSVLRAQIAATKEK